MASHQQGKILKVLLWILAVSAALGIAVFAAVAIYNAFDEDLSADAKAMLAPPPMGAIDDKNGYIAFLGMVAPQGQDQMDWGRKAAAAYTAQAQPGFTWSPEWKAATQSHIKGVDAGKAWEKWCAPETRDCLAEAKRNGAAVAKTLADGDNALLLARYRKARTGAAFTDLYLGTNPAALIPRYFALTAGSALSLAENSVKLHAGDLDAVVAELEREVAFHRRIIAGGRSIFPVTIGTILLARDLLTISELLRSGEVRVAPYRVRLSALTRPQISATALQPALLNEAHNSVTLGHRIRTILRDNGGWVPSNDISNNLSPLRNWAQSLLARPNETANLIAANAKLEASIAGVPAEQFDRTVEEIRVTTDALLVRPWYAEARNPVGKEMAEAAVIDFGPYVARMHDLQALERMVDLQMTLAARGITDSAAMAAYIADKGATSHADPYTGKAFAFDPEKRLLSFEPRAKGRWSGDLKKRYGKVGIVL